MTLAKRQIWILTIALSALVCISLLMAPKGSSLRQGSTYGRSPDGYGAWYADMKQQGNPVQRWQKPLNELFRVSRSVKQAQSFSGATLVSDSQITSPPGGIPSAPMTLLRVSNRLRPPDEAGREWVQAGNVLVLLGVRVPVSQAPFHSDISTPVGAVQVDTSRRRAKDSKGHSLLEDSFGAVVWQENLGQGRIIYASTPFLGANAYQKAAGNFKFLTDLVTEAGYPVWVDEYLHGYKDTDVVKQESPGNVLNYLAKTPLALLAIQIGVILLVLIWGQNQRLGRGLALTDPPVDNSEAYIQAMASVLQKAACSEFVVDTVGKAEQIEVQKALGLGTEPLPLETIVAAWIQQTGRTGAELETILRTAHRHRRISEPDLLRWVENIQIVRRHLPS
ncbi:DUF4350 domain-containing protein [Kovacikia minuta CCNUW1]|uniref:DUF4350 domain-containing protein n=1 Tax=Kovacikia minuta TaxID=2931930 RepID=UPI001CC974D7|nr:DUF4350 domain-containing protein [Kovacikia minuta]UBF26926.1 DUF4350 domain-containing protein [Kovacikia minuta CCNUW1]